MRNLASQFRPKKLDDFVGQSHLLGGGAPLRFLLFTNSFDSRPPSIVIFGPTGSGKTSLARLAAAHRQQVLLEYNGSNFKIESIKKDLSSYSNSLLKPMLFIDEIHRLNIAQQDFLLPILENNEVDFIGASTENPLFSLGAGLRSRILVFEFKPLTLNDMEALYSKVIDRYPPRHGFSHVKQWLKSRWRGDCRNFLHLLDLALDMDSVSEVRIDLLEEVLLHSKGAKEASSHYDYVSALIKSIRGSDEQAALYYLACLIKMAEDPEFIARRLVILASEDIGNANPNALNLAVSTMTAVGKIGYPEARIILSQCVIYLACSPKSNSAYVAINEALEDVENGMCEVPEHLKTGAKGYKYPHDFGGFVRQFYHGGKHYVRHSKIGFEKTLEEWLTKIRSMHNKN